MRGSQRWVPSPRLLAVPLAVLVLAACGSTAQQSGDRAAVNGTGLSIDGAPGVTGDGGSAQVGMPTTSVPSGTGDSGGAPGGASGSGPGQPITGDSVAPVVSGATKRPPIKVGYTIWDTAGFTNLTGNSDAGDNSQANIAADRREMNALVAYANATGGVGGRRLAPPIGVVVSTSDVTNQTTMNSYCAKATEDDKVEVFIDRSFFVSDESAACFANHHVTLVSLLALTGEATLNRFRPYLATTMPSAERAARSQIAGLSGTGYFKGAVVGVVLDDLPTANAVYKKEIEPRLKALGVTPKEVVRVNAVDAGQSSSQGSSAVLRFRSSGITHVFWYANFLAMLGFTNTSDSQGYYPRYGWGDYAGGVGVAGFYNSPTQNANSLAVSVMPLYVLDPEKADQPRSLTSDIDRRETTPGQRRCLDILTKYTGENYYDGGSGRSTEYTFYCEHFLLWLDAARKVGAGIAPVNWGGGLRALGRSFLPMIANTTDFSAGRMDGASTYRVGRFSSRADCKCFVGITPWRRF